MTTEKKVKLLKDIEEALAGATNAESTPLLRTMASMGLPLIAGSIVSHMFANELTDAEALEVGAALEDAYRAAGMDPDAIVPTMEKAAATLTELQNWTRTFGQEGGEQ